MTTRLQVGEWTECQGIEEESDQEDAQELSLIGFSGEQPELVWDVAGTLTDVVAELLVLPAPSERTAPRLVVGTPPALWTP